MTKDYNVWPKYDRLTMEYINRAVLNNEEGFIESFEEIFTKYLGVQHGLCVTNGTVALELALAALDIGIGDEVIVPTYTYFATAAAVINVGATPVLVDSSADDYNIDPESVRRNITSKTKAIILVHIGGRPCKLDLLYDFCQEKGLYLIEDCAQAHGSEWRQRKVGSFGDISCFSFQKSKVLTCGEGGFIATNSTILYERIYRLRNCGRNANDYLHYCTGTNANMNEISAAILCQQFTILEEQHLIRQSNIDIFQQILKNRNRFYIVPPCNDITRSSNFAFILRCETKNERKEVLDYMKAHYVPCFPGYIPIHMQPCLRLDPSNFPHVNMFYNKTIWIKHNFFLSKEKIKEIANAL